MIQIKFIKDTEKCKVGDIVNCSKKSADSAIKNGYAEYINKEKKKIILKKDKIKKITEEPKKELLSQDQVKIEIESISKLEMPLEINKRIKQLSNDSGLSLSVLQKQLGFIKKKEKEQIKNSVNNVNDVNNDTIDTNVNYNDTNVNYNVNYPLVSFVTINTPLSNAIFGNSVFEKILKFLICNPKRFTFDEIQKGIKENLSVIKTTIYRKKEYFETFKPNGKICVTNVTDLCVEEINERIEQYNKKLVQKKYFEEQEILRKEANEGFELQVKNFIRQLDKRKDGKVYLDFNELVKYDLPLSELFLNDSNKFIKVFEEHFGKTPKILNFPKSCTINIEEIRVQHSNSIICVEGRVTSFGEVKPIITEIKYECPSCGSVASLEQDYKIGKLKEPYRCLCGRRGGFRVLSKTEVNACFIQLEDLQDNTDNPKSSRIKAVLFNELCNYENIKTFAPGNEIKCIGMLKEIPIFKGSIQTNKSDWIFEIIDAETLERDANIENISEEELKRINELSKEIDEKGLDAIVPSFAPDVYGYDFIKSSMIFQLCNKRNDRKNKSVRNKSNILLIGDPGVAKSVLGDFALSVSTGSRKAVGGGSSAVGITASVIKEEESMGGYRVEPGAMILAKDLLFLDELNNLSEEDKPKLQEGMSEQTISINKANLHIQMKVTAGIIAVANPKNGSFIEDGKETIAEQFNIPIPILNRFDSVFVVRDEVNAETDRHIADRMIKRHRGSLTPSYDKTFLKKFFTYIKQIEEPLIDNTSHKLLQEVYSAARKTFQQGVKINPRFLESLTRMSISSAKLRQSKIIEFKDIERSLNILSKSQYNISETILIKEVKI